MQMKKSLLLLSLLGSLAASAADPQEADTAAQAAELFASGMERYNAEDYAQAVKCFTKAAYHHHTRAQFMLGECYHMGRGVSRDDFNARSWYGMAARQGDADALNALGVFYYSGISEHGTDDAWAIRYFRQAAEQNHPRAQFWLGICHYYGQGVPQDYAEAVRWFALAAQQELPPAQSMLGDCFYHGRGVAQDYREAFRWYCKAAVSGNNAESPKIYAWAWEAPHDLYKFFSPSSRQMAFIADESCTPRDMVSAILAQFGEIRVLVRLLPECSPVDAGSIEIVSGEGASEYIARATRIDAASPARYRLEIWPDSLPAFQNTPQSYWNAKMALVHAIAHELARIWFAQRYPLTASSEHEDDRALCEGYAACVAHAYISCEFFRNGLSPEGYAELFLSDDAKAHFFRFRDACLAPDGSVLWDNANRREHEASGGGMD